MEERQKGVVIKTIKHLIKRWWFSDKLATFDVCLFSVESVIYCLVNVMFYFFLFRPSDKIDQTHPQVFKYLEVENMLCLMFKWVTVATAAYSKHFCGYRKNIMET